MRRFLLAAVAVVTAATAFAETNAGVSVSVGQPGFYGRLDVGNYPPPVLIYPQPILVQPVAPGLVSEPIYLRVPPEHARNWHKHCHWYGACGQPVYFVQDGWYNQVYVPRYRDMHRPGTDRRGWGNDDNRGGFGGGRGHGRHSDGWNN
jgi:hypothetical protein